MYNLLKEIKKPQHIINVVVMYGFRDALLNQLYRKNILNKALFMG